MRQYFVIWKCNRWLTVYRLIEDIVHDDHTIGLDVAEFTGSIEADNFNELEQSVTAISSTLTSNEIILDDGNSFPWAVQKKTRSVSFFFPKLLNSQFVIRNIKCGIQNNFCKWQSDSWSNSIPRCFSVVQIRPNPLSTPSSVLLAVREKANLLLEIMVTIFYISM